MVAEGGHDCQCSWLPEEFMVVGGHSFMVAGGNGSPSFAQ